VQITFEDAFHGSTRAVNLSQPGGRGRTLEVRIPKGVRAGQRIRLAGQGGNGGDLYLEVEFAPHRLYRLEGTDLYLDLPITPWEAALGATVKVPTLGGAVELNIPAGSQSGDKLRLRGRGLPATPTPGDQYVVLKMVTPAAHRPTRRANSTGAWQRNCRWIPAGRCSRRKALNESILNSQRPPSGKTL